MGDRTQDQVEGTENQELEGEGHEGADEPIIPGTPWKSKEEAARGFEHQKSLIDRQGNELGQLRQQVQETQSAIEQMRTQQTEKQAADSRTDYDSELDTIYKQMEQLDEMDDNYKRDMLQLTRQANNLSRQAAEEQAANRAAEQFQKTLNERDQQQAYQQFYDNNPDFLDPQMQQRINDFMGKDKTGLEDSMTAFRGVKLDDAQARISELEGELAEKNRLLEIKEGTAVTEKVMTKGHGQTEAGKTKQPKLTGAELDEAMMEAARGAGRR